MIHPVSRYVSIITVIVILVILVWTWKRLLDAGGVAVSPAQVMPQETSPARADSLSLPLFPREVVGLVFFGRREFVRVLDCYLKVGQVGSNLSLPPDHVSKRCPRTLVRLKRLTSGPYRRGICGKTVAFSTESSFPCGPKTLTISPILMSFSRPMPSTRSMSRGPGTDATSEAGRQSRTQMLFISR